jgi:predicted small secreted protein
MKYLAFLMLLGALSLTGCEKGPAEKLGEDIDNAATDVGNAIEDACEDATGENC